MPTGGAAEAGLRPEGPTIRLTPGLQCDDWLGLRPKIRLHGVECSRLGNLQRRNAIFGHPRESMMPRSELMESIVKYTVKRRSFIRSAISGLAALGLMPEKLFGISGERSSSASKYQPRFHFVVPDSKLGPFDPNGTMYWKGRHHLFYIFLVEDDRFPDKMIAPFGHASSTDLVNWTIHPWALIPTLGGPDGLGKCWSGDGFDLDGTPAIAYWGDRGQTCLATSNDDLLVHWKKHPANPVILTQPVEGQNQQGDHAPYVWKENDSWYCIRGGYLENEGDTVFLFKSSDLIHWEYLHPLYHPDRRWTQAYEDMACPEFFRLGSKYVVIGLSHPCGCHYYIGRWEKEYFIPEHHGRMNWPGGRYGAPESYTDDKGRRILWAWAALGSNGFQEQGVMSIPRVLTLGEDGKTLLMRPVEELKALRGKCFRKNGIKLSAGKEVSFDELQGNSLEIEAEIDLGSATEVELQVLRSPDGQEQTTIRFDFVRKKLAIDVSKSSLVQPKNFYQTFCLYGDRVSNAGIKDLPVLIQEAPFELKPGENLHLRVFVDRCMVEVFANGRQALCMQVFPTKEESIGILLNARNGNARIEKLESWEMSSFSMNKSH